MANKDNSLKQETCYMCDDLATTKEHVPPKCLFPEAKDIEDKTKSYRKELITVPSCPRHNNDKSCDDEYFLYILSMNILSGDIGIKQYLTKVQRAWARRPAIREEIVRKTSSTDMPMKLGIATETTGAMKVDRDRLVNILEQYARGLFFHQYGEKFLGDLEVYPLFLFGDDIEASDTIVSINESLSQAYKNVEFKGKNPIVFKYSFLGDPAEGFSALKMVFYQGVVVVVLFRGGLYGREIKNRQANEIPG